MSLPSTFPIFAGGFVKKSKRKKLCVALCIPVLDFIMPQTDLCIEALREFTHSKDVRTLYNQRLGSRLIHEARNHLVEEALSKKEVTHILFIDADMMFHFNQLYKWLDEDKEIIGASYVGRGIPWVPWVQHQVRPFPYAWIYDEVADRFKTIIQRGSGIQKIDGGFGLGLTLIKREVFEKLEPPWFDFEKHAGEDMYFAKKCLHKGIPLHIDWDSEVYHLGTYAYGWKDFEVYKDTPQGKEYLESLERQGGIVEEQG